MFKKKSDNLDLQHISEIDKVVHEPARMMIIAYLYVVESGDFVFLMRQTGLTKGNLSSHLSKLDKAGYVEIKKEFVEKIPRTLISLSSVGRKAFEEYQEKMKDILGKFG
ncbi:MAG: transcriptional regulator [Calditrichaeota bacterium]|jgi:DNA-binding MarR family transcriptional regulator|nr:transcriptional regulator [Calditrichota bacterium]MBT7616660.1 transcriptional regulator [Calditrichota bacterium]MBT7788654.1 transcriptional regulator [Calditrichota bacterium]